MKTETSNAWKSAIAKASFKIRVTFMLICIALFFSDAIPAQYNDDAVVNADTISNIELYDVGAGRQIFLNTGNGKSLTLFIFLSPECPLCQNYSRKLNDLNKQYGGQVAMYGIIPGKAYSGDVIKKFMQEYDIEFAMLIDHDKKLTSYLRASVTPQVILLDNKNDVVYAGAIDNWAVSTGKQRVNTTAYFLQDALEQSLAGKSVITKRTQAVGCRINNY